MGAHFRSPAQVSHRFEDVGAGHTAGSTQHEPTVSIPQGPLLPAMRAQNVSAGHWTFPEPPQLSA